MRPSSTLGRSRASRHGALLGLVIHRLLSQRQAHAVRQRRKPMNARSALLLAPPQGLASKGDGLLGPLGARSLTEEPLRPGPELSFDGLPVDVAQDGMQGGGTGRARRKASGPHQVLSIMAPPLRAGRLAPVATEPGTTGQSEDGHQGVALTVVLAAIWDLS